MDITIYPRKLRGSIDAIPSKSQAHRLLICAAFADKATLLICPETNQDIEATVGCLNALGADIRRTADGYIVTPISCPPEKAVLNCFESGSTLRFMLPIVGALGINTTFYMAGRLPMRPLSPLWEEMERNGCSLSRPTENTILCQGKLSGTEYVIDGGISSQFITGLLFAMALIPSTSTLTITGKIESKPYIDMTHQALRMFGVDTTDNIIRSCYPFSSPGTIRVEGDWSNGAFFLAANALGCNLEINGLNPNSHQGDRACQQILNALTENTTVYAENIPDLVPILSVVAGAFNGATFKNIQRLRMKESDRVETVAAMLRSLGATVITDENSIIIYPAKFRSCTIHSAGDHRIAMAAAIAACVADGPITITGAECVAKSYPAFWDVYRKLGGHYEQYVR